MICVPQPGFGRNELRQNSILDEITGGVLLDGGRAGRDPHKSWEKKERNLVDVASCVEA